MGKGVGVYIGKNEVIAVSAVYSAKGPQIKAHAIEPINPEAGEEPVVGKAAHKLKKLTPEAKAIWFQSLTLTERMELFCAFTDLILAANPRIVERKDAQPIEGRVLVLPRT